MSRLLSTVLLFCALMVSPLAQGNPSRGVPSEDLQVSPEGCDEISQQMAVLKAYLDKGLTVEKAVAQALTFFLPELQMHPQGNAILMHLYAVFTSFAEQTKKDKSMMAKTPAEVAKYWRDFCYGTKGRISIGA
jgi:hypothetical protein